MTYHFFETRLSKEEVIAIISRYARYYADFQLINHKFEIIGERNQKPLRFEEWLETI